MKKSLTGMLILLAGAYAVHAQGTVDLFNYGTGGTYVYVGYKPATGATAELGGTSSGPTATLSNYAAETQNGPDWTVQLYAAPGANQTTGLLPVSGMTATFANGTIDPTAGTWYSTAIGAVPNAGNAGSMATVQLFAWYNEGGAITTLAQALADGVPTGESALANVTLGGPQTTGSPLPPATLPTAGLGNFTVQTTPEPSTIALGVIGASAFLMRLRRKK